jgi:dTDP-3-amino-3,4,6-trideoxy-alpha-D-glucose transaminase
VHLYGQAADLARVRAAAGDRRIAIVEDCCQAHLATCDGIPVGTGSVAGAFSFYPTKNLGALGDGGAVVTGDATLAERIRQLRNGGQTHRHQHLHAGVNSRLDDIQAAVLRARLPRLRAWTTRRREIAAAYRALLAGSPVRPVPEIDSGHVYHLFPVRSAERDRLQAHLRAAGVETLIHYPIALSRQPAFAPYAPATCPVAERAAGEVLSLPLHPRMTGEQVSLAADAIRAFEKGRAFA